MSTNLQDTILKSRWLMMTLSLILLQQPATTWAQITTDDDEVTFVDEQGNEEEIEFPEAMNEDIDSLLQQYHAKTYLTDDENCQMSSQNPTFSKEVYIERLKRLPTIMEMPYNDVVQSFIDRYTGRLRHNVSFMLGASNFFMPIFEEALEIYQLPLELKYLPIIESGLKPDAVSRAGAVGLWQFMLTTAKDYGLEVNSLVDERRDPLRGSIAAAHYLSDLYKIFGDWNLVIAAYNCGPANVNKAIHRARQAAGRTEESPDDKDYWKIYPYLPKETRGYVPAFIAANYVMTYYCEHNICPMKCELPQKSDTVMVSRNMNLEQVAAVLNLDIEMLRALNPSYRRNIVPGDVKPSPIRLLPNDVTRFIDQQDSIFNYRASELLSKRNEVEVKTVTASGKRAKARKGRSSAGGKTVTIRQGDTLGAIARRNGTTVRKLRQLNGIRGNNIRAGRKIRVR